MDRSEAPSSIIDLDRATKTYGDGPARVVALHECTLSIPAARMVALLGRSGSGKSTLLNLIGGVDRPTSGAVRVAGSDLAAMTEAQLVLFRRRTLGFVFQSFHLLPELTAFDNIAVPWLLDRALTTARRREIERILDRLGLADKKNRYPDELSGGQQQRIALARAVVHRPKVVLADEPTGNLDARSGREILDLMAELHAEFGATIVMATHSEEAAVRCHDRIFLDDGKVLKLEQGVPM